MKWTHRRTVVVAYIAIAVLVVTRPDFEYWPWLPLLGVGGGSIISLNIIVVRRQHNQSESAKIAAKKEELKLRKMEDDYMNKPMRDNGKLLLKLLVGVVALFVVFALVRAIWEGPESAQGIVDWIELLRCQCS